MAWKHGLKKEMMMTDLVGKAKREIVTMMVRPTALQTAKSQRKPESLKTQKPKKRRKMKKVRVKKNTKSMKSMKRVMKTIRQVWSRVLTTNSLYRDVLKMIKRRSSGLTKSKCSNRRISDISRDRSLNL